MKRNILYIHNDYADRHGGEYSVYQNDVKLLRQAGHKITTLQGDNGELYNASWTKKMSLFLRSFFNTRIYREVTRLVGEGGTQIAIVQNTFLLLSPSVYFALKKLKVPIIQMIYNYRFICPNAHLYTDGKICERCLKGHYLNAVKYKCVRGSYSISLWYATIVFLERMVFKVDKMVNVFVTPDNFLRNKLIEGGIDPEKIVSIKNPFDVNGITISEEDEGYFLFVGRIIRQKGMYTFLKAAERLRHVRFIMVGDGDERYEMERVMNSMSLPNLEFVGPKYGEDMVAFLRKARAVVIPSEWYDNYPVILSQAYAFGKPVIASNIDGIPEVVESGVTGFLFSPQNVDELCSQIERLNADKELASKLGKNARKFLEDKLSADKRLLQLEILMGGL